MENVRAEQIEALEVFCGYNEKFVQNIRTIITELEGDRKEDTDKFLENIIKGINWEIGVLNGVMPLINEKEERIQKEEFNSNILRLSQALEGKDDLEIAKAMKETLPMFEKLGEIAREVLKG
ncbi:MAG: molecular chaperone [Lachnospiraceae bacterium]|nr:molecular chaperone [Lachnospiraceae bacterium]